MTEQKDKKRILFVDDDPHILKGLERMLRSMRKEWDMRFAPGGQEGLDLLQSEPFDVLVTDMRMPGIDGAKLLARVKEMFPKIIRIVLSGYSNEEFAVQAAGTAQQFIAKPCDADTIRDIISRALAIKDILDNQEIIDRITTMDTLPTIPDLYQKLVTELSSMDVSMQRIGEIIAHDIGMSAKILQLVNSAFFGLPQHITTPEQAVRMLGLDTIKALVLTSHIFDTHEIHIPDFKHQTLLDHCLGTAVLSQRIALSLDTGMAKEKRKAFADDAFIAGLLHDVGILVLAVNFPDEYAHCVKANHTREIFLHEAESLRFKTSHAEVGGYLMGLWGLPETVVEAIAFHHAPRLCPSTCITPLTVVHAANVLDQEIRMQVEKSPDLLDTAYLKVVGVLDLLPEWKRLVPAGTEEKQEENGNSPKE